jgi:3-oxoacyl-[acyl-carrier protein] reductase
LVVSEVNNVLKILKEDLTMRFKDKVAIVTGSARGLGKEIAQGLAREGASLVVSDIEENALVKTAEELTSSFGTRVEAIQANVKRRDEICALVKSADQTFGRIDILINNAGICSLRGIEEVTEEEWDEMMNVNLRGVFFCSQAVTPLMKRQGSGTILNMASIAGKVGGVVVGPHYSASKAGVICLTKSFAKALAPYGIRVNAVSPGPTDTEMTREWPQDLRENFAKQIPLGGRFAESRDICEAALFLVSDGARFITGEILDVNGGLLMD